MSENIIYADIPKTNVKNNVLKKKNYSDLVHYFEYFKIMFSGHIVLNFLNY